MTANKPPAINSTRFVSYRQTHIETAQHRQQRYKHTPDDDDDDYICVVNGRTGATRCINVCVYVCVCVVVLQVHERAWSRRPCNCARAMRPVIAQNVRECGSGAVDQNARNIPVRSWSRARAHQTSTHTYSHSHSRTQRDRDVGSDATCVCVGCLCRAQTR